jgi:hypothetical protein
LPPQVVEKLHLAYIGRTVREVSANLNRIAARSGVPKTRLKYEARKRGWRCQADRRAWLSTRLSEGYYDISDLAECFGLHHSRIESWARRGLLGTPHGHGGHGGNIRFAEKNIVRFIRRHPHEYDLGRVDKTWFKGMLFGRLAGTGERV